jgi:hypothetical protein
MRDEAMQIRWSMRIVGDMVGGFKCTVVAINRLEKMLGPEIHIGIKHFIVRRVISSGYLDTADIPWSIKRETDMKGDYLEY